MDLNLFTSENPSQQFKNWLFSNDCITLGLIGDFYPTLFNRLALLNKILLARFNINCYIKTKLDEEHLTYFPKNLLTASKHSSSLILFDNCQKVLENRFLEDRCRMSWLVSLARFGHEANISTLFYFHHLNLADLDLVPSSLIDRKFTNVFWLPLNDLIPTPNVDLPLDELPFANFPHLPALVEEPSLDLDKAIELLFK